MQVLCKIPNCTKHDTPICCHGCDSPCRARCLNTQEQCGQTISLAQDAFWALPEQLRQKHSYKYHCFSGGTSLCNRHNKHSKIYDGTPSIEQEPQLCKKCTAAWERLISEVQL